MYFSSNIKKLYVSISSGIAFGDKRDYPTFTRWSYHNIFDGIYICIEDPMYKKYPESGVMWFFGEKNNSYVFKVEKIVRRLMDKFDIKINDLYIVGSSMGGAISLMLGNLMEGCNVCAMNAQYHPASFSEKSRQFFLNKLGIDIYDMTMSNFDFIPRNKNTIYFIITNLKSSIDRKQIEYFCEKKCLPIEYGIHQYENIILWNHMSGNGHSTFPERLFFPILLYYIDICKNDVNLNRFERINLFFSEFLYYKYEQMEKIDILKKQLSLANKKKSIFAEIKNWFKKIKVM